MFQLGCASVGTEWEQAKDDNTTRAYVEFLSDYPQSIYTNEARATLENRYWKNARKKNTESAYKNFLIKNPKSKHSLEADWRLTIKRNTEMGYKGFLTRHPESKYSLEADWRLTKKRNTEMGYKRFLTRHPQSKYEKHAEYRFTQRGWAEAKKQDTEQSYEFYLSRHPQSEYDKEARHLASQRKKYGPIKNIEMQLTKRSQSMYGGMELVINSANLSSVVKNKPDTLVAPEANQVFLIVKFDTTLAADRTLGADNFYVINGKGEKNFGYTHFQARWHEANTITTAGSNNKLTIKRLYILNKDHLSGSKVHFLDWDISVTAELYK